APAAAGEPAWAPRLRLRARRAGHDGMVPQGDGSARRAGSDAVPDAGSSTPMRARIRGRCKPTWDTAISNPRSATRPWHRIGLGAGKGSSQDDAEGRGSLGGP